MSKFTIPTRADVSTSNQAIFDNLSKQVGMVPNLYAYLGKHDNALGDYLAFSGRKSTLSAKEKEVVSLVVSQKNGCSYCLAAHTAIGKMAGFNDDQIISIRKGDLSFDPKLQALANLAIELTEKRGVAAPAVLEEFFAAGYTELNFIDVVFSVVDKFLTNFVAINVAPKIDFPLAPQV